MSTKTPNVSLASFVVQWHLVGVVCVTPHTMLGDVLRRLYSTVCLLQFNHLVPSWLYKFSLIWHPNYIMKWTFVF